MRSTREVELSPDEPDVGSESMATSNSDEEPLAGEPAVIVELMLQQCLDPDERQQPAGTDIEDSASETDSGSDADWGVDPAHDSPASIADREAGAGDGSPGGSVEAEEDAEELEEGAALRFHLQSIRVAIEEFNEWAHSSLASAVNREGAVLPRRAGAPALAARPAAAGSAGGATAAAAASLLGGVSELRALQAHLRELIIDQHSLCAYYTEQLLRVCHSQAELALKHHQDCRQRHRQLRIVRRESARLCRTLDAMTGQLRTVASPTTTMSGDDSPAPGSPGAMGEERAPRQRQRNGGVRWAPPQTWPSVDIGISRGSGKGGGGGRSGGGGARGAKQAAARPSKAVSGAMGSLGLGRSPGPVPSEVTRLVHLACLRAARHIVTGEASVSSASPPRQRHRSADRPRTAASRHPKQAVGSSSGHRSRSNGPSAARDAPTQPSLPAVSGATRTSRRPPWEPVSREESRLAARRVPEATRTVLRQPAVQAAIAQAMWSLLSERRGA